MKTTLGREGCTEWVTNNTYDYSFINKVLGQRRRTARRLALRGGAASSLRQLYRRARARPAVSPHDRVGWLFYSKRLDGSALKYFKFRPQLSQRDFGGAQSSCNVAAFSGLRIDSAVLWIGKGPLDKVGTKLSILIFRRP